MWTDSKITLQSKNVFTSDLTAGRDKGFISILTLLCPTCFSFFLTFQEIQETAIITGCQEKLLHVLKCSALVHLQFH